MTNFLWGVYPYLCVALFFVVPIIRMAYRPFGWSTRASGLFNRPVLGTASLLLHWGLAFLVTGHLAGLFGGLLGSAGLIRFFYWIGMVGGFMVLTGSIIALLRRVFVREVRALSAFDDYAVHLFFIPIVSLALYQVLINRIFGIAYTASAWVASLWTLSPQPALMDSASTITKVHVFLALTFIGYFPFTKLVHVWTYPINYFARPYQSMRTIRYRFQRRWELAWRSDKSWLVYGMGTVAVVFITAGFLLGRARTAGANAAVTGDPHGQLIGQALYVSQCARCHGVSGHGDGPGADSPTFGARPRDFTRGEFHFVSTDNGVAAPRDLEHTIRHGLPSSGMPSFSKLSDAQVRSLVSVIDGFWKNRPAPGHRIVVPPRPDNLEVLRRQGAALFASNCTMCHGKTGHGDGPVASMLRDPDGRPVHPADLADGRIKDGATPKQLYLRIAAGIPPGLMPSFSSTLSPHDIWSIVTYLRSDVIPSTVASRR